MGSWGWGACGGEGPLRGGVSWEWNLLEEWSLEGEDLVGVVGVFWG